MKKHKHFPIFVCDIKTHHWNLMANTNTKGAVNTADLNCKREFIVVTEREALSALELGEQ